MEALCDLSPEDSGSILRQLLTRSLIKPRKALSATVKDSHRSGPGPASYWQGTRCTVCDLSPSQVGSECLPGRHDGCHLWVLLHTGRSTPTSTANETSESWSVTVTAREKGLRCRCTARVHNPWSSLPLCILATSLERPPPTFPACLRLCVSRSHR